MAERYLKVEIITEKYSDVYVKVDDQDPRFKDLFDENGGLKKRGAILDVEDLAEAVEETIKDYEWEESTFYSQGITNEIPAVEAKAYAHWDLTKRQRG